MLQRSPKTVSYNCPCKALVHREYIYIYIYTRIYNDSLDICMQMIKDVEIQYCIFPRSVWFCQPVAQSLLLPFVICQPSTWSRSALAVHPEFKKWSPKLKDTVETLEHQRTVWRVRSASITRVAAALPKSRRSTAWFARRFQIGVCVCACVVRYSRGKHRKPRHCCYPHLNLVTQTWALHCSWWDEICAVLAILSF